MLAKWKITDINYYYPNLNKANSSLVYIEKQQVYYTEVDKFIKSFYSIIKIYLDKINKIKLSLFTLLKRPAEHWYYNELSKDEQQYLITDLTFWKEALTKR